MSCSKKLDSQTVLLPGVTPVTFFSLNGIDCKTSLILLPLIASTGLVVPKILWSAQAEGRLIEYSLNAISGMKLSLPLEEIQIALEKTGGVFASAPEFMKMTHDKLVSAEESEWQRFSQISLLTLNGLGAKSAVYDIKMNDSLAGFDLKNARDSVHVLKEQSEILGINASYFLSPALQHLGQAIGPALELIEALEILKGRGPYDVKKIVLEQGADLLLLAKQAANRTEAKSTLKSLILRGDALEKIEAIIEAQRGNSKIVHDYSQLPIAVHQINIPSIKSGFVAQMRMSLLKKLKEHLMRIHPGAGLIIHKNVGDSVQAGEALSILHFPEPHCPQKLQDEIRNVFVITDLKPSFSPLIAEKIKGNF